MTGMLFRVALVGIFGSMLAPAAQAHAFLDHAVPAVGSTAPPTHEVRLWFTEAVEPAFSAVTVTNAAGDRVNEGKIDIDSRNPQELRVRVEPRLPRAMASHFGRYASNTGQFQLHR